MFSHTGTNRRNSSRTIKGMGLRSMSTRSPMSPPRPQFGIPDLGSVLPHGASGFADAFIRAARNDQLPVFAYSLNSSSSSGLLMACRNCCRLVWSHSQLASSMGSCLGVRLGETLMRAAYENAAADHAHAWPEAQHVFTVLRIVTADDGGAAGHEFSEIIAGRA